MFHRNSNQKPVQRSKLCDALPSILNRKAIKQTLGFRYRSFKSFKTFYYSYSTVIPLQNSLDCEDHLSINGMDYMSKTYKNRIIRQNILYCSKHGYSYHISNATTDCNRINSRGKYIFDLICTICNSDEISQCVRIVDDKL